MNSPRNTLVGRARQALVGVRSSAAERRALLAELHARVARLHGYGPSFRAVRVSAELSTWAPAVMSA
jgi:hypothetical protein